MTTETVNEASTAWLTVQPLDRNGAASVPSSATYRVDCQTTGSAIRVETVLTPAESMEIALDPTDNAIQAAGNPHELRRVTVVLVFGAGDEHRDQYDYWVRNLSQIT